MIPNRALERKGGSLTMLCYQVMPMLPRPTNAEQRQVIAKAGPLAQKCAKIPAPKKKPEKSKTRAQTVKDRHEARNRREVAELFEKGPQTVNMIQKALGLKIRESAAYRVHGWRDMGLVVETETPDKYRGGRVQKWWKLTNCEAKPTGTVGDRSA